MALPSAGFAFENYGGSYQLRIRTAEDLAALAQLDDPFWMATSAPVEQLSCDSVLLTRLDRNRAGRIQSAEVREAIAWLLHMVSGRQGITAQRPMIGLDEINTSHEEGQALAATAKRILRNLGRDQDSQLSLDDVRNHTAIFAQGERNGDGVVPCESLSDPEVRVLVQDIMATKGTAIDLNGQEGVNEPLLDAFLADATALLAWLEHSGDEARLFPLGAGTAEGHGLYGEMAPVIEGFFLQCRVAAVDAMLGRAAEPRAGLADEAGAEEYLAQVPLAKPNPAATLDLNEQVNPCYRQELKALEETVLQPLLGADGDARTLDEGAWEQVKQAFAPYEEWMAAKTGGPVETLGPEKLRGYVQGEAAGRLRSLIHADVEAGVELAALQDLEYLILLQRWALDLCNNFVSFPYLYRPKKRAMFEAGRMVMAGRVFNLNFRVSDVEAHAAAAARSGIYLLYSEITGAAGLEPTFIVTPVTSGRSGEFAVGKRGVLFDLNEVQWNTRVVRIVENPVSIGEAMAAPFKRLGAAATSAAEKITTGAEHQLQTRVSTAATSVESGLQEGVASVESGAAPTAQPAKPAGNVRDMMLAGGVAAAAFGSIVAAFGSAFAFVAAKLGSGIAWWQALAILGAGLVLMVVLVLVSSALVAYLKLRRRNLSVVLEASGWAINAPMYLRTGLKRLIAYKPAHPRSFRRLRKDLTRALARAVRSERE